MGLSVASKHLMLSRERPESLVPTKKSPKALPCQCSSSRESWPKRSRGGLTLHQGAVESLNTFSRNKTMVWLGDKLAPLKNQNEGVKLISKMRSTRIKTQRNIQLHHLMAMMFLSKAHTSIRTARTSHLSRNLSQKRSQPSREPPNRKRTEARI